MPQGPHPWLEEVLHPEEVLAQYGEAAQLRVQVVPPQWDLQLQAPEPLKEGHQGVAPCPGQGAHQHQEVVVLLEDLMRGLAQKRLPQVLKQDREPQGQFSRQRLLRCLEPSQGLYNQNMQDPQLLITRELLIIRELLAPL